MVRWNTPLNLLPEYKYVGGEMEKLKWNEAVDGTVDSSQRTIEAEEVEGDATPPVNEWLNGDSEQCEFRGGASRLSVKRLDLLFHYPLC